MVSIDLPKFAEVLVAIYNTSEQQCYCGKLHQKIGVTNRHLRNLIVDLEDMGLIARIGNRKIKYIMLTEKGSELAEHFMKIIPKLKR